LFTPKGIEIGSLSNVEQEIVKFVEKNETKESGVSFYALQDHFLNVDPMKLRDAIFRLQELFKIYEEKPNHFRVVYL